MKTISILLLLLWFSVSAFAKAPNVLIILVDDMSYYGISSYGDKPWTTPHIDNLAENGMKWTHAYAYPVCSPTRAAILTGRNPVKTGITNWIPGWAEKAENPALIERPFPDHLTLSEYTIAEALKANGYHTALVGKWHLGEQWQYAPAQQGFEYSYSIAHGNTGQYFVEKDGTNFLSFSRKESDHSQYITEHFVDQAIDWLDRQNADPWFLYFSTHVVHMPILASESMVEEFRKAGLPDSQPDSATYAAMHKQMDNAIGRLLQHIRNNGLEEDTLIVFLSDNGGREPQTDNAPLQGGKGELLEGGIRVPLIFQWPGHIPAGSVQDDLAVVDDLYPTLLDMAGIPLPEKVDFDGLSLASALKGEANPHSGRTLFFHYPHYTGNPYGEPSSALRKGKWKLIHLLEEDQPELYDLESDPGEENDLAEEFPQLTKALFTELNQWRAANSLKPLEKNSLYDPALPTTWNGDLQSPAKLSAIR